MTTIAPREDRRLTGIALALIGAACFTGIDSSAKWLSQNGLPTGEVVFVRYAGQLILVLALFLPREGRALFATKHPWLEIIRGLGLMGSTIFNFIALRYLPLTVTSAISFVTPLILSAASGPLLREHVGWRRWLAILVGFCGVLVIIRPGTESFQPAALLSICGSACYVVYLVMTRRLAGVDSVPAQQFYAALIATLCMAPFGFSGWTWPSTAPSWIAFGLMGLSALVGHQLLTMAHRFAPATVLAPFGYFQIITMTTSSILIFGQPPEIWILVGAPIVIGSGLYIWLRERQLARNVTTEVVAQD